MRLLPISVVLSLLQKSLSECPIGQRIPFANFSGSRQLRPMDLDAQVRVVNGRHNSLYICVAFEMVRRIASSEAPEEEIEAILSILGSYAQNSRALQDIKYLSEHLRTLKSEVAPFRDALGLNIDDALHKLCNNGNKVVKALANYMVHLPADYTFNSQDLQLPDFVIFYIRLTLSLAKIMNIRVDVYYVDQDDENRFRTFFVNPSASDCYSFLATVPKHRLEEFHYDILYKSEPLSYSTTISIDSELDKSSATEYLSMVRLFGAVKPAVTPRDGKYGPRKIRAKRNGAKLEIDEEVQEPDVNGISPRTPCPTLPTSPDRTAPYLLHRSHDEAAARVSLQNTEAGAESSTEKAEQQTRLTTL